MKAVEARSTAEQGRSDERDSELRLLRQQHSLQVQGLQQIIQSQMNHLTEKDQTITQKDQALREKDETIAAGQQQLRQLINENRQLDREKNQVIVEKERAQRQRVGEISQLERQLGQVRQQLEESEWVIALFQRRIAELEQLRPATNTAHRSIEQHSSGTRIKLTWREGEKAPHKLSGSKSSTADDTVLYVRLGNKCVYAYTISTFCWSRLPNSPTDSCPSAIINNFLTHIGGWCSGNITNQLFSLTGKGGRRRWTEEFPPMPTKRWGSTALCTGTALIVSLTCIHAQLLPSSNPVSHF